ncbi:MAG: beta-ketoacyl-ACP synthase 3 [Clostridiales bacterium]|nr:beta-ketoacyl-ACP synthase 3 [Clostridiales bacterium]
MGISIIGCGHKMPKFVATNKHLEEIVDTSNEWIIKRTGIKQRRLITDETLTELATQSSKDAIDIAQIDKQDIGLVIAATFTSDTSTPALASNVQKELGIERAIPMDLSAGCTGFIYALATAKSLMESLDIETALVIGADYISKYLDWEDRKTCVLFGDGSGAVVLKRGEQKGIGSIYLNGKPDVEEVLVINDKQATHPWRDAKHDDKRIHKLAMKGAEVYEFACGAIVETINKLKEMSGSQIKKIIPHQANGRIIRYASIKSKIPLDNFYINIQKYANTSAATLPIAIDEAWKEGWLKKGDQIALVGFGAGLTWGGMTIEWNLPNFV